jgi:hypothetical protein
VYSTCWDLDQKEYFSSLSVFLYYTLTTPHWKGKRYPPHESWGTYWTEVGNCSLSASIKCPFIITITRFFMLDLVSLEIFGQIWRKIILIFHLNSVLVWKISYDLVKCLVPEMFWGKLLHQINFLSEWH